MDYRVKGVLLPQTWASPAMPIPEPVAAVVALTGADQVSSPHLGGRQLLVHMAHCPPVGGRAAQYGSAGLH